MPCPRGVEDAASCIFRHEFSAIRRGGIPPSRAVSQYHKQKGRADDPSSARPFVFIPIYACRNRLRNSTVFAFCGCSKMSAGVPSSQMTPSAM